MIDIIISGGWTMVPLILCALLAIAFIFERLIVLSKVPTAQQAEAQLETVERVLTGEGEEAAVEHCARGRGPLNYVFAALMKRYDTLMIEHREFESTRGRMIEMTSKGGAGELGEFFTMQKELSDMKDELILELDEAGASYLGRYLTMLNTIGHIAPLLGLLGTIIGMIVAFKSIAIAGTGDPKVVAGGISQALVTTATGLVIAIPTIVAHRYLARRADGSREVLEAYSHAFANALIMSGPMGLGERK